MTWVGAGSVDDLDESPAGKGQGGEVCNGQN